MSPRFGVVLLAVFCAGPLAAQPASQRAFVVKPVVPVQEKVDLSTPALAIKSLVAAYNRHDLVRAAECVTGVGPDVGEKLRLLSQHHKIERFQYAMSEPRIEIQGDQAVAILDIEWVWNNPNDRPEDDIQEANRVLLHRINGQWKIVSDVKPASKTEPDGGVLSSIAKGLASPDIMFNNLCQRHLTELAFAALMLSNDYEEVYAFSRAAQKPSPLALETLNDIRKYTNAKDPSERVLALLQEPLHKALWVYLNDPRVLWCPIPNGDKAAKPAGLTGEPTRHDKLLVELGLPHVGEPYSFNQHLDGVSEADLARWEPERFEHVLNFSRVVLFYEGKDGKLDFRHGRKANVVFIDLSVRAIDENEAKTLIWKRKE